VDVAALVTSDAGAAGGVYNWRVSERITGRWGKPSEVLLDLTVDADGTVRGVANPGRQDAPIADGRFDPTTGAVRLAGETTDPDGARVPFLVEGRLDRRTLRLRFQFGESRGELALVRVEEYRPPRARLRDHVRAVAAPLLRRWFARLRPTGAANAARLRARGESIESVRVREATAADIPALAALHVETWNLTYRTTKGPTVATRTWQWNQVFAKPARRDFVVVLEDRTGRLIGFAWGKPHHGEFAGELSKIYLRWEYHGLGLGRVLIRETARRFLERGITSFVLFAEATNPTVGFYDRMGGERLRDERGFFTGSYAWRDASTFLDDAAP
jgi:ribosomal protein S18 acetylase RimI-like enzyme